MLKRRKTRQVERSWVECREAGKERAPVVQHGTSGLSITGRPKPRRLSKLYQEGVCAIYITHTDARNINRWRIPSRRIHPVFSSCHTSNPKIKCFTCFALRRMLNAVHVSSTQTSVEQLMLHTLKKRSKASQLSKTNKNDLVTLACELPFVSASQLAYS